jgi:hypothetical protein
VTWATLVENRDRVEEVGHQRVLVKGAAEGKPLAGGPAVPDRPDGGDVLFHPGGRLTPRHGEATLDVRPYLGPETEPEPAARDQLDVVGEHGHAHRVPGERHGDRGR